MEDFSSSSTSSDVSDFDNGFDEEMSDEAVPSTSSGPTTITSDLASKQRISRLLDEGISEACLNSYSLYCLDESLIPKSIKDKYNTERRVDLEDIRFWMKPDLSSSDSRLESLGNSEESYYVVRYKSQSPISASQKFISQLFGDNVQEKQNQNVSAMIIIPIPGTSRALAYSIGRGLTSIMNKHAIVKQWGLELVASKDITSQSIKELAVFSQRELNEKKKITKTSSPRNIGVFSPEAGVELFYKLRLKRDGSKGLVEGSTKFQFSMKKKKGCNERSSRPDIKSDIQTLVAISRELYEIYTKNNIHPEYKDYISKEVDGERAEELDNELVKILTRSESYDNYLFNLNPHALPPQHKKSLDSLDGHMIRCEFLKTLHNNMNGREVDLEFLISFKYGDKIDIKEEPVCALLIVNAFLHGENVYNYTSGKWFQVPPFRFPYIRREIALNEISQEKLGLICYTEKHAENIRLTKKNVPALRKAKEFSYNADAAETMSNTRAWDIKGILCDHITVKFTSTSAFTFEFADIFTRNGRSSKLGESNCIIHVKRRGANDFENHCMQLLRTNEFLCYVIGKKKYSKLLLQGCVNTLYANHQQSIIETWITNDVKNLTYDYTPITSSENEENWINVVLRCVINHCDDRNTTFKRVMRDNAQQFLSKYRNLSGEAIQYFVVSLNALFYCDSKSVDLTLDNARNFCDLVQCFYKVSTELFGKGILRNTERKKKLYLILAIIDDKKKAMKKNSENKYVDNLTDQQLLTLEIIKRKIESEFQFKWTVIEKEGINPDKTSSRKRKEGERSSVD